LSRTRPEVDVVRLDIQARRDADRLKEKDRNMNRCARISVLAILVTGIMVSLSGCNKLAARDQLNRGVDAYKSAHYEEAIGHFQKAIQLDPNLPMAKTYLGTALAGNVVPGLDTPDNLKMADSAIAIFNQVLARNPNDVPSMKQVAAIYLNIKRYADAKEWQKKVLARDPKDPEASYTVGVVDWTQAHINAMKELGRAGMTDDGEGNVKAPRKTLEEIRRLNDPLVEEATQYLHQAISNRENYYDAMQFMNLIYRRKADVDFSSPSQVRADLEAANEWSAKAMGARKASEEKKNASHGGITMDSNGNMK